MLKYQQRTRDAAADGVLAVVPTSCKCQLDLIVVQCQSAAAAAEVAFSKSIHGAD
jgi:hypothetical protein